MLNGYYVIKSNNEFVASSKNVITTSGFSTINKYLAGSLNSWADYLAVGVFVTKNAASASDTQLEYEVGRYQINLKSYATISGSNQIFLKADLPDILTASISDIGIFSSPNLKNDNFIISDFSELVSGSTAWLNTTTTSNSKYGASNVYIYSSGSVISNNNLSINLNGYAGSDYASLLVYSPANASGKFQIRFQDTAGYLWNTASGTASVAGGSWMAVTIPFTNQPDTNFNYIVNSLSINFVTAATSSLVFDALKLNSGNVKYIDSQVISRTILPTPIIKDYGKPMQIEYYMQVT